MTGEARRAVRALVLVAMLVLTLSASSTIAEAHHGDGDPIVFEVDTFADGVDASPGDGICDTAGEGEVCTLRAAVMEANADPSADDAGSAPDHVIRLDSGEYVITIDGNGEDNAETGDLDLEGELRIEGVPDDDDEDDLPQTQVTANEAEVVVSPDRVFDVQDDAVIEIHGVQAQEGEWQGNGGGIRLLSDAILRMTDSAVSDSEAGEDGGGFYVYRDAQLFLTRVVVEDNEAADGGGIYNNSDGPEPVEPAAKQLGNDDDPGLTIVDSVLRANVAAVRIVGEGQDIFGGDGGGIYNDDEAVISDTSIIGDPDETDDTNEGNEAENDGGGIYNDIDENSLPFGEPAELTILDSAVVHNEAGDSGGGIYNNGGLVHLENAEVGRSGGGNLAGDEGAGIYNTLVSTEVSPIRGELTIIGGAVSHNESEDGGGGIYNDGGIVETTNVAIDNNSTESEGDGGGLYNDVFLGVAGEMTLMGGSVDENDSVDDGAGLYNDADFAATGTTFNENDADSEGGAIYNGGGDESEPELTLSRVVIDLNVGENGGGIYNERGAIATVSDSSISGNFTNVGADAGGIWNGGIFRLERSTVSGNGYEDRPELTPEALQVAVDDGGGLYNADDGTFFHNDVLTRAVMTIVNSTISGNAANHRGGGIYNQGVSFDQVELLEVEPVPTVILNHSTVTGNTANVELNGGSPDFWGGGIFNEPVDEEILQPGEVRMMNTIVAGNTAEDGPPPAIVLQAIVGSNCGGKDPVSDGFNLESADSCGLGGPGDLKNMDPKLGPLAANGGPTLSHALLDGSPALDKAGGGSCPTTDQRGTSRPQGPACDIGSYERFFQAPQPQPQPQPAPQPPAATPQPPPAAAPRPRPRAPRAVRRCRVPNVRGKTVAQARRAIARAGCRAVVMGRRFSTTTAPGRVLGQSIRAGRRVRRGTIVRLLIARRVQPVRPPFTG
jgi:CSLREA domain-containing protein